MAAFDRDSIQEQMPLLLGKDPINCQILPVDLLPYEYDEEREKLVWTRPTKQTKEKLEYLNEAFEEFSASTQENEGTEHHRARTCNSKCCKNDPLKFKSIKKAKKIGTKIILKSVLRNLFHKAIIREIFIYLSIVVLLVSTSFSLVSIIRLQNTTTTNGSFTGYTLKNPNATHIVTIFDYIGFGVSALGTLFSLLDFALYLRHRGCRVLKRTCKRQELVQPGDEEKAECFNDSCACEGTCGKGCTTVMDIVRIVVLETIFYPNLLLKLFQVIVIRVNNYNSIDPFHWFMASLNICSIIIFVYLKRVYIFFGVVRSIRKLKTGVNKKCEGVMFIITFFMYMCALMFLQFLMIIIIVGKFYAEYKQEHGWRGDDGQLWYMMIFTYLMPLIGMPMFFFVHQFWTSKLPVDIVRDLMSELQTKGKGSNIRNNKTDTTVEQVMNHLGNDQFIDDYEKLYKTPFYERLLYPFFSPTRAIISSLYIGAFAGFFICSFAGDCGDWLPVLLIAVGIIACLINVYAANVGSLWLIPLLAAALWIIVFIIIILNVPPILLVGLAFLVRSEEEARRKKMAQQKLVST